MKPVMHKDHKWGISKMEMIYCVAVQLTHAARKQEKKHVGDAMNLLLKVVDDDDVKQVRELVLKDTIGCNCPSCTRLKEEFKL